MIELLVVIAIIAVLASLLLPALSRVKSSARRLDCLNRLRQLNMGIQHYATDHEQAYPERGMGKDWFAAINQTLSAPDSLLICPDDKGKPAESEKGKSKPSLTPPPKWILQAKERSYVVNGFSDVFFEANGDFLWTEESTPMTETQIQYPSSTIVLGEKYRDIPMMWLDVMPLGTDFLSQLAEGRHMSGKGPDGYLRGSANYAFADGHVEDIPFGKATCPVNNWCVTDRWRTHAALCSPRVFSN